MHPQYKITRNGMIFIARREALVLVAYQDGPHMSIGFGYNDPKLKEGDEITVKEAFALLKGAMAEREKRLSDIIKVELTPNQFDALMSLHYQSGNRYLQPIIDKKTKKPKYPGPFIIDILNAEGPEAAFARFPECDTNLAGTHLLGLKKRRLLEQKVALENDYGGDDLLNIPFWMGDPRKTKMKTYRLQPDDL